MINKRCGYCKSGQVAAELLVQVDGRSNELLLCRGCYQAAMDALHVRLIKPTCETCNNSDMHDEDRCRSCMQQGSFAEWEAK